MRKFLYITLTISACLLWTVGCQRITNPFEDAVTVAKVGKKILHRGDLEGILPTGISSADSIALVDSYVNSWVRKEVKEQQARRIFHSSAEDIEELVEEYRSTLLARKLEQYCVDNYGGEKAPEEQSCIDYYNNHRSEFMLDRDIVKGRVVALPSSFRQKSKIKELIKSSDAERIADLTAMCDKNSLVLSNKTEWADYSDFLKLLPTKRNESYGSLLSSNGVQEMSDGKVTYYFVITSSRRAGEQSPYESVADVVRWIVAKQHREEIIKWYDDSVYNAALKSKDIVINIE